MALCLLGEMCRDTWARCTQRLIVLLRDTTRTLYRNNVSTSTCWIHQTSGSLLEVGFRMYLDLHSEAPFRVVCCLYLDSPAGRGLRLIWGIYHSKIQGGPS